MIDTKNYLKKEIEDLICPLYSINDSMCNDCYHSKLHTKTYHCFNSHCRQEFIDCIVDLKANRKRKLSKIKKAL